MEVYPCLVQQSRQWPETLLMLDNTIEISAALNALAKEGCIPTIDELAALSPYLTRHIKRFGNYELDLSAIAAPVTDDLTFEIEPLQESSTIEADYSTLAEPNGE